MPALSLNPTGFFSSFQDLSLNSTGFFSSFQGLSQPYRVFSKLRGLTSQSFRVCVSPCVPGGGTTSRRRPEKWPRKNWTRKRPARLGFLRGCKFECFVFMVEGVGRFYCLCDVYLVHLWCNSPSWSNSLSKLPCFIVFTGNVSRFNASPPSTLCGSSVTSVIVSNLLVAPYRHRVCRVCFAGKTANMVFRASGAGQDSGTGQAVPPVVLVLVGVPGSGKSTFCADLDRLSPGRWLRINQVAAHPPMLSCPLWFFFGVLFFSLFLHPPPPFLFSERG
jgi:hypothetical protein